MKRTAIVFVTLALPLTVLAQDVPMPRMLKGMEKGAWRVETLENSAAKGRKLPAMTMCTESLMKQAREQHAAKGERKCTQRLLKDAADESVMEIKCPDTTVTTTMKRESAKSVLADVKATGKHPMTMKMRYTHTGPCREGQAGVSLDKDSEQCRKARASAYRSIRSASPPTLPSRSTPHFWLFTTAKCST